MLFPYIIHQPHHTSTMVATRSLLYGPIPAPPSRKAATKQNLKYLHAWLTDLGLTHKATTLIPKLDELGFTNCDVERLPETRITCANFWPTQLSVAIVKFLRFSYIISNLRSVDTKYLIHVPCFGFSLCRCFLNRHSLPLYPNEHRRVKLRALFGKPSMWTNTRTQTLILTLVL